MLGATTETVQLRRLTDIGRALTYATSLDQVARLTVEQGSALLEAPAAVLMLADPDGEMQVRASHGIANERATPIGAPQTDQVFDRLQDLLDVPTHRLLAVPLVVGGAVTGLLAVGMSRFATEADELLLSALADQAAVALEGARLGGEVRLEMEGRLSASEGATNAKDRALATLAHDIRSPLGAIDAYCWNLQDGIYGSVTDRQRHALGRIRMSGQHLLSLLDSVMDMARLTAGVMPVPLEPVHSLLVARDAVDILAPAALAKRQALHLDGGLDLVLLGNHARLRQVLVNLVGNAVKFTPEGGSITLATRRYGTDGAAWGEIVVTDTGPGIAPAEQTAIFEPYYRSDGAASLPGVGLGLAISQALVAQMGGVLALQSELGAGSSFAVRLPLEAPRDVTTAP